MTASIRTCLAALVLAISCAATSVQAGLVSINSIGAINMTANTQSSPVTLGLLDLTPGSPVTMLGWSLGLRVVPLGGATGTVTLDEPSFVNALNNIFQGGIHSPGPLGVGDNSPASGDFTVSNSDNAFTGVVVPGTTRNLVDLKFNASNNAGGNFALQLVDLDDSSAANLVNSYWFDDTFTQHYLAVDGAAFTSGIQLGTISVTAVPEPSSMLLGGVLVGLAGWKNRRRRRAVALTISNALPDGKAVTVAS